MKLNSAYMFRVTIEVKVFLIIEFILINIVLMIYVKIV